MSDAALRRYDPAVDDFGADGYPVAWHEVVKDHVRTLAGHRCERCGHPYDPERVEWEDMPVPEGKRLSIPEGSPMFEPLNAVESAAALRGRKRQWSPCDGGCHHPGPVRIDLPGGWAEPDADLSDKDVQLVASTALGIGLKVQALWRILTVHHLTGDKADCRWWNLAALCQRCHLAIQGKVVMPAIWAWEHSEWFKPHAAGWYGWAYLGQDLTREETMQRMDELLLLERQV